MEQSLTTPELDEPYGQEGYAAAEHISIGEELSAPPAAPDEIGWRRVLAGPWQGKSTEIVYFREGWLRLRTGSKNGIESEQLVELGFLDPKFTRRWRFHGLWLWVSALSLACLPAIWLASTLGLFDDSGQSAIPAVAGPVIVVVIIASMALTMLVRNARRSVTFVTRTGRVPAVQLTALPGRRADINRIAKEIRSAVSQATKPAQADAPGNLRAEMQGHYRLRDAGVISAKLCDEGTRRILAQFG